MAIFQDWFEYLSTKIGVDSSTIIGKTSRLLSSVRMKLSMFVLVSASAMSAVVGVFKKVHLLQYIFAREYAKTQSQTAESRLSIE